jgi:hypothetical protein
MTVLLEKDVDIESVKEEMAKAEAEKVQPEPSDESHDVQNDESDADTTTSHAPEYEAVGNETTSPTNNTEEI